MTPPEVARTLKEWRQRRFQGSVWIDPPGQAWEGYVHPTDELVMVIEGEVEFEVAERRIRPRPGEELLIPAGTLHSVWNRGSTVARWLYAYREAD